MLTFDKLIIPLASSMVGLIPVLINLLVNALDKRGHVARRNAALTYLNQRVGFLTSWFQLQKEINNQEQLLKIKGMMSNELTDIYEEFAEALLEVEKESLERRELLARVKRTNGFRRFFLLYTPYNTSGWLYHTLYYMSILPLFMIVGYEISKYLQSGAWFQNIPTEYLYVGGVLIFLVLLFRGFARRAATVVEDRMATLDRKTSPLSKLTA
jgi:hypothetical protein